MKAIGIVFLFNRNIGTPEEISKKFSDYFSMVSENLVKEGLMDLVQLKDVLDAKRIFWAGIKEDFEKLHEDSNLIADLSWNVFKNHVNLEASEDIRTIIYNGSDVPWKFSLITSVLYD